MKLSSSPILMLDLGNVVFPLEFDEFDQWLIRSKRNPKRDIAKDFMPIYLDYERGKFSTSIFLSRLREELECDFKDSEFEEKWISCWKRDTEGMEELLLNLKKQFPLYVLSNTNALHMNNYTRTKKILQHFDRLFLSYELDCSKPDVAIYQKVTGELNCQPEQILFFDDKPENIEGAKSAGWKAEIFISAQHVRERFMQHTKELT
jgi:glucose-1-phosphatase